MTSNRSSIATALLLSIACVATSCCQALHVATLRSARRRTTPSRVSMPQHYRHHDLPTTHRSYQMMHTTSNDDEPFDSRRRRREPSRLSELANRRQQQQQQQQQRTRQQPQSPPPALPIVTEFSPVSNDLQPQVNLVSQLQSQSSSECQLRKLPPEELLSDARRDALHSNLESLAREASKREERIRTKLAELGRQASSLRSIVGVETTLGSTGVVGSSDHVVSAVSSSAKDNIVGKVGVGEQRRFIAEGIVPAAASTVASLGGLALFRESMIRREQKEAEVRQYNMIKQSATKKRKHESVKRRDGRILGKVIGRAAASLGALAVGVGATEQPASSDFEMRREGSSSSVASSIFLPSNNNGGKRAKGVANRERNFMPPIGVGAAYAFDDVEDAVVDEEGTQSTAAFAADAVTASAASTDATSGVTIVTPHPPTIPPNEFSRGTTSGGTIMTPHPPIVPPRDFDRGASGFSDSVGGAGVISSKKVEQMEPGGNNDVYVQYDGPQKRKKIRRNAAPEPVVVAESTKKSKPKSVPLKEPQVVMTESASSSKPKPVPSKEPQVVITESTSTSKPKRVPSKEPDLYVEYDGPQKRKKILRASTSDPTVVDDSTRKVKPKRIPLKEPLVVTERSPPRKKDESPLLPPPEIRVMLEKRIPKEVVEPPAEVLRENASVQESTTAPPAANSVTAAKPTRTQEATIDPVMLEKRIPKEVDPSMAVPTKDASIQEPKMIPPPSAISVASTKPTLTQEPKIGSANGAKGGKEDRKKPQRESIRPEALEYIKEYNVPKKGTEVRNPKINNSVAATRITSVELMNTGPTTARPNEPPATTATPSVTTNNAATTPRVVTMEKMNRRSSSPRSDEPPTAAGTPATTISGAFNTAKAFSVGVTVGTVSLITQQKRRSSSSSSSSSSPPDPSPQVATFHYSNSGAVNIPPHPSVYDNAIDIEAVDESTRAASSSPQNSSYLESIQTVPKSAGAGMSPYLDGLSGSPPLVSNCDDVVTDDTMPHLEPSASFDTSEENHRDSSSFSTPVAGEENFGPVGASSMASEGSGPSSYPSSLSGGAPLSSDAPRPTKEISDGTINGVSSSEEEKYATSIDDSTTNTGSTLSQLGSSGARSLRLDDTPSSPVEVVLDDAKRKRRRRIRVFTQNSVQVEQGNPGDTSPEAAVSHESGPISPAEFTYEVPSRPRLGRRNGLEESPSSTSLQMFPRNRHLSFTRLYLSPSSEDHLPPTTATEDVNTKFGTMRIKVSTERFLSVIQSSKMKHNSIRLSNNDPMAIPSSSQDNDHIDIDQSLRSLNSALAALDERLNVIVEIDQSLQSLGETMDLLDERLGMLDDV